MPEPVGMPEGLPARRDGAANAFPSPARHGVCARARADVHRTLLEVSRATASHRDLDSLLRDLTSVLQRVAPFDVLRLVIHDPERDLMRLHTLAAVGPVLTKTLEVPTSSSPSGLAMQTQHPVVVPDIEVEARFPLVTEVLRAEGMKSFCAIPLTSPLRRLGALHFASHEKNAFCEADVEFLQQLSGQVALAVDNTLHHEAAQRAGGAGAQEGSPASAPRREQRARLEPRTAPALHRHRHLPAPRRRHDYTSLTVYDAARNAFDMSAIEFAGNGRIKEHMIVPLRARLRGRRSRPGSP
jgi:formate hydrogenlyase transcriptional activator